MPFREWLKRLFERAHPVWEVAKDEGHSEPVFVPVKVKPVRKSKAKKANKKK